MVTTSKRTHRCVAVAAATLAGVGILSAGLSGAPASADTGGATSTQAAVKSAGVLGIDNIFEFVARALASKATGTAGGSLFDLLTGTGDPNAQDFAEIKQQLTGIQDQLGKMDIELETLTKNVTKKLNKSEYANDVRALNGYRNTINELYGWFMPITAANQKLVDDQAAGADAATVEADRAAVAQRIEDFKSHFGNNGDLVDSIHDYLVPGATSVLEARGAVMMDKGYVTASDSDALRAEYDLWAGYAAIAALMASFNDNLYNPDGNAAQNRLQNWQDGRTVEQENLPPRIGTGTIVATPNGTTSAATVYVAPARNPQSWLPTSPVWPEVNSPVVEPQGQALDWAGSATDVISARMAQSNETLGGQDWSLWSDADAKNLVEAVAEFPGETVGAQLSALAADTDPNNLGPATNWQALASDGYAWTTGTQNYAASCGYTIRSQPFDAQIKSYKFPITAHEALDLDSSDGAVVLRSDALADFSVNDYDTRSDDAKALTQCKDAVESKTAASDDQAGTVLVRTATVDENYMAE